MEKWSTDFVLRFFWRFQTKKKKNVNHISRVTCAKPKKNKAILFTWHISPLNFIVTFLPLGLWLEERDGEHLGKKAPPGGTFLAADMQPPPVPSVKLTMLFSYLSAPADFKSQGFLQKYFNTFHSSSLWSSSHYNPAISWLIKLARLSRGKKKKSHLIGREVSHMPCQLFHLPEMAE